MWMNSFYSSGDESDNDYSLASNYSSDDGMGMEHDFGHYAEFLTNIMLGGGTWRGGVIPTSTGQRQLGKIRSVVVGIRHYRASVSSGSLVHFQREPTNSYDPNAIKVLQNGRTQIGHVKRELAAVLSPYMDRNTVVIRGKILSVNMTHSYPMEITVLGPNSLKGELTLKLRLRGFEWKTENGRRNQDQGGNGTAKYIPSQVSAEEQIVNQKKLRGELEKVFEGVASKLSKGYKRVKVSNDVMTELYPHQVQALAWMCDRENNAELPPFWKKEKKNFKNIVTDVVQHERPAPVKGGILADEMGLGKSLQMIALILTNSKIDAPKKQPTVAESIVRQSTSKRARIDSSDSSTITLSSDESAIVNFRQDTKKRRLPSKKGKSVANYQKPIETGALSPVAESKSPNQKEDVILTSKPTVVSKRPSRRAKSKALKKLCSDDSEIEEIVSHRSIDSSNDEKLKRFVDLCSDDNESDSYQSSEDQVSDCSTALRETQKSTSKNPTRLKNTAKSRFDQSFDGEGVRLNDNIQESDVYSKFRRYNLSTLDVSAAKTRKPTLIVCTVSLLSNWLEQFETHIDPNSRISIFLYYGPERKKASTDFIMSHDIVITTYTMLAQDYKSGESDRNEKTEAVSESRGLLKCTFLRLVLDEGHLIRNPKALMSKAVFSIESERRWVLSGTPIQNSLSDLWALVRFLRLEPFESPEKGQQLWKTKMEKPVLNGSELSSKSFKSLLMTIVLRRTKAMNMNGKPIVNLPSKTVKILKVKLSEEELELYKSMESSGKVIVGSYFREGRQLSHYAHIISIITRLRQLVCHPALCKKAFDLASEAMGSATDSETRQKLIETLKMIISSGSDEECCVCLDSLNSPVITKCAHVFCRQCIEKVLQSSNNFCGNCPLCRSAVDKRDLIEAPREVSTCENGDSEDTWHSSSKVDVLIKWLNDIRNKSPDTKSIVVSQFTSFLTLIEKPLIECGFKFVRFDGSLSVKNRDKVLTSFRDDSETTVLLLSLTCGNLGLNLTCASNLFLMDPAWNPSVEDQCFDRCHRLGQLNDVTIYKLICAGTVEDQIVEIQEKKRKIIQDAFSFSHAAKESREKRINDIKLLFGIS